MKKLALSFLLLFVSTLLFTCENEPLDPDLQPNNPNNNTDCLVATQVYITAVTNFTAWDGVDETVYPSLCSAYATSLQGLIDNCGDPTGSFQALLGTLGDCSEPLDPDSCETAIANSGIAETNLNNASNDMYTQFCNVYVMALEEQIDVCGDADGSIQLIIDGLGDCQSTQPNAVEISLTVGTLPIEFDQVTVVAVGNILEITGETSAQNNYMIYFEVVEGATGMEIINSAFVLTLSTIDPDYFPSTQGFDDFTSTITENGTGTLVGSFGGVVSNSGGADLSVSQGIINIAY